MKAVASQIPPTLDRDFKFDVIRCKFVIYAFNLSYMMNFAVDLKFFLRLLQILMVCGNGVDDGV